MTKTPPTLERLVLRTSLLLLLLQATALFATAGTFDFWQAWAYLATQLVTTGAINVYLLRRGRELLQRRFDGEAKGETERVHRVFQILARLLALSVLVLAGLDRRFGWSHVSPAVTVGGTLAYVGSWWVIHRTFAENAYASSVVEIGQGQAVVRSGPYGLVRHPMYTGALLGTASMPLALGSLVPELMLPLAIALFVTRILAEERFLARELPGYPAYMRATPKRLVPGLW